MLDGIESDVTGVPPDVAANDGVPDVLEVRLTVVADDEVAALPYASRRATVMGPSVGVVDEVPDTAPLV